MSKIAVTAVALVTKLVIVMPGMELMDAPPKLIPRMDTCKLGPGLPLFGVKDVSNGPDPVIVNTSALLVPAAVFTVTLRGPLAAPAAIEKVATICVEVTDTVVIVTPVIGLIEPPVRPVPLITTGTTAPGAPEGGVMFVSASPVEEVIEKVSAVLVPFRLVTVMLLAPNVAPAATVNMAEICVALAAKIVMVTPAIGFMDEAFRLFPLIVTGTLCPCPMLVGLTKSSIGA